MTASSGAMRSVARSRRSPVAYPSPPLTQPAAVGLAALRARTRHRWTVLAGHRAARRSSGPPSARQRAPTDAAPCRPDPPPQGAQRSAPAPLRSARAPGPDRPPSPPRGGVYRSLRSAVGQTVFHSGMCAAAPGYASLSPHPSAWAVPLSTSPWPTAVPLLFFFLLRKRNVILAGPRQGPASLREVRMRTLDMA